MLAFWETQSQSKWWEMSLAFESNQLPQAFRSLEEVAGMLGVYFIDGSHCPGSISMA